VVKEVNGDDHEHRNNSEDFDIDKSGFTFNYFCFDDKVTSFFYICLMHASTNSLNFPVARPMQVSAQP